LVAPALGARLPALLLSAAAPDANWLNEACSTLIALAETLPRAELGLATTEAEFSAWLTRARPRDVAILHAGMLRLAPRADGAALSQASLVTYDENEFARSRAESTLYRRLEQRPRTQGLFELNPMLPARFGSAQLEVDLLCEDLRIAVEIDGYHHFRDEAAYRRDRSKDVALQGLGYLVVRVLASDVMTELDFVIGTIDQVVERQRKGNVA
jgi:very-short-patch-repair endonuclease